jgi:hypothetical protein
LREPKPLRGLVIARVAPDDLREKTMKTTVCTEKRGVFVTYPADLKASTPCCGIFWGSHRTAFMGKVHLNKRKLSDILFKTGYI